jgi:cytochrome b
MVADLRAPAAPPASIVRTRVWDLPTRLFHWSLVACVAGSLIAVNAGGNAIGWHFRFGYAILTLLLFRLAWGFIGPRHARFSHFPPDPAAAWRYLRGESSHVAGHNPLGALSVYALLLSLAFQVGTGLFSSDSIMWDGPLRHLVSGETSDRLTGLHQLNRLLLIGLIVLHLGAVAWYALLRREPLVKAMITGDREVDRTVAARAATEDGPRERLLALAVLVASAAGVWALVGQLR